MALALLALLVYLYVALYSYLTERALAVSAIERANTRQDLTSFGWKHIVQHAGARYPAQDDSFHYPTGAALESLRQGVMTYNTYVSALQLPASIRPSEVEVWSQSTASAPGSRRFFLGQWVDALDTVNKWLEATVVAVRDQFVFIHYNGWERRWDEWLHVVGE